MKLTSFLSLTLFFLIGCAPGPAFSHESMNTTGAGNQKTGTDCTFKNEAKKLCLKMDWVVGPAVKKENKISWKILSMETEEVVHFKNAVNIELWMPDMGHGSSPTETILIGENYQTSKMYFIMRGAWVLNFFDGEELIFEVPVNI